MTEESYMEVYRRQAIIWAELLNLLSDYDKWCPDPVCAQCIEGRRREEEEQ